MFFSYICWKLTRNLHLVLEINIEVNIYYLNLNSCLFNFYCLLLDQVLSLFWEGMTFTKYLLPCYAFNLATKIISVSWYTKKIKIVLFNHSINIKLDMPQLIVKISPPSSKYFEVVLQQHPSISLHWSPKIIYPFLIITSHHVSSNQPVSTLSPSTVCPSPMSTMLLIASSKLNHLNNCQFYSPVKKSSLSNVSSTDHH